MTMAPLWAAMAADPIPIYVATNAAEAVRSAAGDLADGLGHLYPNEKFVLTDRIPETGRCVVVCDSRSNPLPSDDASVPRQSKSESHMISVRHTADRDLALVSGVDPLGTAFAVYDLLDRLGFGHFLSFNTKPPPRQDAFSFDGWTRGDTPIAKDRIVFNWHNFLSGCTGWNLEDWRLWIDQSRRMRFNTVMVHAYGNNPMFSFRFNGQDKPVGYLTTSAKGRDWGTEHVNDVRRLAGGDLFDGPVFGADAALAPEERRAEESQSLMKEVFGHAAARGMHVCFALDVDTESANPQNLIMTLPEKARFQKADGSRWFANPDTPEGYSFYKAQAKALFDLYPQIDRFVVWVRTGGTPWTELKKEDLPPAWRAELEARQKEEPALAKLARGPGRLGLGKIVEAFQRALKEIGRGDVRVMSGSWNFDWMKEAHPYYPEGVPFISLDWNVVQDKSQIDTPERRAEVRETAAKRPVIPVVWGHHDDGHYIGRSYRPWDDFLSKLAECGADSFGIIHWTTRPLDLYFKSLSKQVWYATSNQPLRATCDEMAERCFGPAAREAGGSYLFDWINTGPIFGRDTSDRFIDRPFPSERVGAALADGDRRIKRLEAIKPESLPQEGRDRLSYFRSMEYFYRSFHEAEGAYQEALARIRAGMPAGAAARIMYCNPFCRPYAYAQAIGAGGATRGELGVLITMNTKWLTYFRSLRQFLGMEPVRLNFAPTQHEDLAQGAGHLTFLVDAGHGWWRCFGERETGAQAFTIPTNQPVAVPAGLPREFREVAQSGIESDRPLRIKLDPILLDQQLRGYGGPVVRAGESCRLQLLFADPSSRAAGERVFDLAVNLVTARSTGGDIRVPSTRSRFLRVTGHGSGAGDWNSILELRCAALDPAGGVEASGAKAGYEAVKACDGRGDTRWAAQGDGAWIRFALKPDVAFDRIEIDWYEGDKRNYRFDLDVSDDGRTWKRLAAEKEEAGALATDTIDVFKEAGGTGRLLVQSYDLAIAMPGRLELVLTPKRGKALLNAAVLEPVTSAVVRAGGVATPFAPEVIASLMKKANAWQMANPWRPEDRGWIRGTWYTGVMAAYGATHDEDYLKQALQWAQKNERREGTDGSGGNKLTCVQTWAELSMLKKDPSMIGPAVKWLNSGNPITPTGGKVWYLEGGRRYADSLYVGPPALAMLAKATGERTYIDWMNGFYWDVHAELFDSGEGLYYRDKRFIGQKTANGKKVLWSRGNGWVFAGLPRILDHLPPDEPSRARFVDLFKTMAASLAKRRCADGFWRPNLDDPAEFQMGESSGTGFFCYGLAWGIRNGLLDRETYLPVVKGAWIALVRCVNAEGKVEWGQQVGDRPVAVKQTDTHEYVTGTFLLAGSEMLKLAEAGMLK